jgi:hypothetical protein
MNLTNLRHILEYRFGKFLIYVVGPLLFLLGVGLVVDGVLKAHAG